MIKFTPRTFFGEHETRCHLAHASLSSLSPVATLAAPISSARPTSAAIRHALFACSDHKGSHLEGREAMRLRPCQERVVYPARFALADFAPPGIEAVCGPLY